MNDKQARDAFRSEQGLYRLYTEAVLLHLRRDLSVVRFGIHKMSKNVSLNKV